jgi:hypothetical protein
MMGIRDMAQEGHHHTVLAGYDKLISRQEVCAGIDLQTIGIHLGHVEGGNQRIYGKVAENMGFY